MSLYLAPKIISGPTVALLNRSAYPGLDQFLWDLRGFHEEWQEQSSDKMKLIGWLHERLRAFPLQSDSIWEIDDGKWLWAWLNMNASYQYDDLCIRHIFQRKAGDIVLFPGIYPPSYQDSFDIKYVLMEIDPPAPHHRVKVIGPGSGVDVLAAAMSGATVYAKDINPMAVLTTRFNAEIHGLSNFMTILQGDAAIISPEEDEYDLIVWNVPVLCSSYSGDVRDPDPLTIPLHQQNFFWLTHMINGDHARKILEAHVPRLRSGGKFLLRIDPGQTMCFRNFWETHQLEMDVAYPKTLNEYIDYLLRGEQTGWSNMVLRLRKG